MRKPLAILFTVVFLFAASVGAGAQEIKWRLVTHAMPGTEQQRIAEVFCETVKTLSGGKFVIMPYAAGVLFPVFESFDGVANGVVDAAMVYSAYWTGKDPLFTLTTQPGSPLGTYAEGAYLAEQLEPWFEKLYEKHRIKYLGHAMVSPINEQLMSVTPINTIEDVKGKKIRSSGFGALFYRTLACPISESYTRQQFLPAFLAAYIALSAFLSSSST